MKRYVFAYAVLIAAFVVGACLPDPGVIISPSPVDPADLNIPGVSFKVRTELPSIEDGKGCAVNSSRLFMEWDGLQADGELMCFPAATKVELQVCGIREYPNYGEKCKWFRPPDPQNHYVRQNPAMMGPDGAPRPGRYFSRTHVIFWHEGVKYDITRTSPGQMYP